MIYATHESEEGRIMENATIYAFENEAAAREYLLTTYDAAEWDRESATIEPGRFADAWIRTYSKPHIEGEKLISGLCDFEPFYASLLWVTAPGQHPGGKAWWVTPSPDVLVISSIRERGE